MSPESRLNILRHKLDEQSTRLRKAGDRLDLLEMTLRRERKEQTAERTRLQSDLRELAHRLSLLEQALSAERDRAGQRQWLFWALLAVVFFVTFVLLITPHP